MPSEKAALQRTVDHIGRASVIRLSGSADMVDARLLREILQELAAKADNIIVLDLTDLEFIGCEGIDAILAGKALAGIEHGQIRLVGLNPEIRHILEITRLTEVFPIFDTVDNAVKA